MNSDIMDDLDELEEMDEEDQIKQQDQNFQSQFNANCSALLKDNEFIRHMALIEQLVNKKIQNNSLETIDHQEKIIHQSNQYASQIDRQIQYIIKNVKNIYNRKLPELQSIVNHPGQYCKALLEIQVNLKDQNGNLIPKEFKYLTPHQSMTLKIVISAPHEKLPEKDMAELFQMTNIICLLNQHRNLLMIYLQSCMKVVAPNLCHLVGSQIASKLICAAGGIDKLAMMPACNIQVMGGSRAPQIGLSMLQRNHTGIFGQMDIVKEAPKKFQMQLVRMLATNTAKCARGDYLKSTITQGAQLRDQMMERFQKIQQEGGLSRIQRPLPIPDQKPGKKRGGKKYRKNKELYMMSQLKKNQNRMKFGEAEEQIQDGVGFGMLKNGIGKLKVKIKKQKLNPSKKMQERMTKKSGMQSTLDLAGSQGIQLINPNRPRLQGTQSYFNKSSGFKTVLNAKLGK